MDPDRWRQIEQLYHAALEKQAGERAAFLDQSCASDLALRREMESLLAVADDADGYLRATVRDATLHASQESSGTVLGRGPLPPTRKLGRYELLEQIGKGGMGVVYRAVDPAIGRPVAIKTILLDDGGGEQSADLRSRLLRESQAGGQLTHPNIVAVYDVCEDGATAYIVMEFVVGGTLAQVMAGNSAVRSVSESMRIVQECAGALDYAHSRGVVHRDVKPGNIMLQTDGAVKIADFGIAKAAHFTPLTQSGTIVGSPHYMAPEQWKGEAVTGRADQYALAAVAYAMLTGHRPFESDSMASLAAKTLYDEPPAATSWNPMLPPAVDMVLRKGLAKSAAARYETCSQFTAALRAACDMTTRVSAAVPISPPPPRKLNRFGVLAASGVLASVAGGAWLYQRNSTTQIEIAYWTSIKDSNRSAPFEAYLKRYPEGQFASLAQAQLTTLKSQHPPAGDPPPPTTEFKTPLKTKPAEKSRDDSTQTPQPPQPRPKPPVVADPYAQADSLLKRSAYAEAIPYYSQAIASKADYRSYFGRASAYQHLEQTEQAIEDYTQAIHFNPDSAMAYHERAVCLARLNQDDRALADYSRAIQLSPGYPLSWNGRGVIYLHRKDYQKAIADFTEAIRLKPSIQPYKNRAAAKKALGDISGANADLNQAKALGQ